MAFYRKLEAMVNSATSLSKTERDAVMLEISEELEDLRVWLAERKIRRPERWFVQQ